MLAPSLVGVALLAWHACFCFWFIQHMLERPGQKSVLRGIFMEWRHQVAWELEQKAWMRDDVCYVRPRCVFRFMLHEPQFKKAIAHLWKCIDMWMCAPQGCAMLQTLHIAVESMPSVFIKMCSYEGTCLRRHASCTRTKGYRWCLCTDLVLSPAILPVYRPQSG